MTTWNPLDKNASVTLSNGNLSATGSGGTTVRSTTSYSTGKYYFEVNVNTIGGGLIVGAAQSTFSLATPPGLGSPSVGYLNGGNVWVNGGNSLAGSSYTTGDIIGVCLDVTNSRAYFSKNGVWQGSGNPSAGTGGLVITSGTWFAALGPYASTLATAVFKAPFTYPIPTGASAWDSPVVDDLAASALVQATATATLDVEHNLAAVGASVVTATAAIDIQHHLAAAAGAVATGAGALDLKHHLAAAAASIATVTAALTADPSGTAYLAADAVVLASASASLDLQHHLAGIAAAIATATASLELQHTLAADARAASHTTSALSLAHHFSADAVMTTFASADLTGPTDTPVRPPPMISLRWSDDRGATFGNPIEQSMGGAGEFLTSIKWNRLGMARDRVFELSWSGDTDTCLSGAFIETIKHKS